MLIKKICDEGWAGVESVKQVEKLENQSLSYLKDLFALYQKINNMLLNVVQYSENVNESSLFRLDLSREDTLQELVIYCDNLELNLYVFRVIALIINVDSWNSAHYPYYKNKRNFDALNVFAYYFLHNLRKQYKLPIELFKNERFFKDLDYKAENSEPISEGLAYKNELFEINSANIKKDFGENFLAYNSVSHLLEKNGVSYNKNSYTFFQLVYALRVQKNISVIYNILK